MKHFSVLLFLSIICFSTFAQNKNAKPGYFYNTMGAKIEGDLVFILPKRAVEVSQPGGPDGKLIYYKNGKKISKLKAEDVQSFVIDGDSIAVISVSYGKGKEELAFAKIIREGEINLYQIPIQYTSGGVNIAESFKSAYRRSGKPNASYLGNLKREKKALSEELSDYPSLSQEIDNSNGTKVFNNLIDIVDRYNNWFQDKNK